MRAIGLALLILALAAADGPEAGFSHDLAAALATARAPGAERPLVLAVGATWCRWCRQMQADAVEHPELREALSRTVAVEIDSDAEPYIAASLAAQTLPTVALVNRKGLIVRVIRGYMQPADLAVAVRLLVQQGDDARDVRDAPFLPRPLPEGLAERIALLGTGNTDERRRLRDLLATEPTARDHLWALLTHAQLAVRVDAAAVLALLAPASVTYDPFAEPDTRTAQAQAWRTAATPVAP